MPAKVGSSIGKTTVPLLASSYLFSALIVIRMPFPIPAHLHRKACLVLEFRSSLAMPESDCWIGGRSPCARSRRLEKYIG